MHLSLSYNRDDEELRQDFERLRDRDYVVRSLVPPGYEDYFRQHARYVNAHTSTAIEGSPIAAERAMEVLVEGPDTEEPNEVEMFNLEMAYGFVGEVAQDRTLAVDEGLIRFVNSTLLRDLPASPSLRPGRYRTTPSRIVDATTRQERYLAPRPEDVKDLMAGLTSDLKEWVVSEPGPAAAALAHFALISIHPFEDGNGRTARLIGDLVLWLTGSSFDRMLTVSKVIFDNRAEYYDVLRETQGPRFAQSVDVTPFVRYHTRSLCRAAEDLERRVIEFNRRRDALISASDGFMNERQVTGLMFMLDVGAISSSAYASMTGSSQSSAIADLNALVAHGMCRRQGSGRRTRYTFDPAFFRETSGPNG